MSSSKARLGEGILSRPLANIAVVLYTAAIFLLGQRGGEKPRVAFFVLAFFCFLMIVVEKRGRFSTNKFIKRYSLLVALCGVSAVWAIDMYLVYSVWIRMVVQMFGLLIFWNYFRSFEDVLRLAKLFMVGSTLLFVYNIFTHNYGRLDLKFEYGGVNTLGPMAFGGIVIGVFLWMNRDYLYAAALPLHVFMLILTTSQKSAIAALLFVVVLSLTLLLRGRSTRTKTRYAMILLALCLITWQGWKLPYLEDALSRTLRRVSNTLAGVGIVGEEYRTTEEVTGGRSRFAAAGFRYWLERPLLGYGINNFRPLYGGETGLFTYSHNTFLELLVGVGIVGLLLFISMFYWLFRSLFRSSKDFGNRSLFVSALLAFLFIGMAQELLYMDVLFVVVSLALGFLRFGFGGGRVARGLVGKRVFVAGETGLLRTG